MRNNQPESSVTATLLRVAVFVLLAVVGGWAQKGRANTSTGSAVLHIRVNVIPTVLSPAKLPQSEPSGASVSYLVPLPQLRVETTTQEIVLPAIQSEVQCLNDPCRATVTTTTIVAR